MRRKIPLEDFFRKPEKAAVRLSPDGTRLAYLGPFERRMNLFVRDLETGEESRVTSSLDRDIAGYLWAGDDRLLYWQDQGGDENYRLYSVGIDGSDPRELTPFEGVKCEVVDELEDRDNEVLFQMNRRDPKFFDVYRLDVGKAKMTLLAENPGNIQRWITDHEGRVRLATTTDGVRTSLLYRDTEDSSWSTVATYDFKETVEPLFFTFDGRSIYVTSNVGRDKAATCRYDLRAGLEAETIFEHPDVDVSGLLHSKRRKVVTGATFVTDRLHYHFFDPERRRIQEFIDERLPERENSLVSHSRDETRYIVYSGSDRTRGSYHLLDTDKWSLTKLFDLSPWLSEEEMARMETITYRSRDGLIIHGYLTLPPGEEPRRLPLLVHPHGGPWHRDTWGFNPEIQFLANRGYAVLQMNFRGSTGYGRAFWKAGFGQWGLKMQDDVTDAVQWAIDSGIADPARVAIYGGSYGGYAALSGLTRTPDLYACGVSYVGVSNLFTWMAAIPPYWKPYLEVMYEMVGHPERDEDRFRETSPFFNADRIRAPLLVAQGANDPRVPKHESDQIVKAVKERGIPVEYIVKANEGHGFQNEENQFDFYRAMERFLDRYLGE